MRTAKKREIENVTIKKLVEKMIYRIDLDADYQREKIWSRSNQEELLDSVLLNIDIPKLYLARTENDDGVEFECIDGKQRITALIGFYDPTTVEGPPLTVKVAGEKFSYAELREEHPTIADKMDNFELTFVIYPKMDDELFIREIFRRLQLGIRLNSGERLKSLTGAIRDFVFKEIGKSGPFFRNTRISDKRFSREFTLAQICINSFSRESDDTFVRARFEDLEEFFEDHEKLDSDDANLVRIKKVLELMDDELEGASAEISSRAVAVSVYLFVEELYLAKKTSSLPQFNKFLIALMETLDAELERTKSYEKAENTVVLEEFHKNISQASVEVPAIRRRNEFLRKAFAYFVASSTKGKIIGSK